MDSAAQWATPLLLDAKREYATHLADVLAPRVLGCILDMWAHSRGKVKPFRDALREIPRWNAHVVLERTAEVQRRVPYLGRLIKAVFLAYVKVMVTIKLSDAEVFHNINFQVPSDDQLVHKVFFMVADAFYERPSLVLPQHKDARREVVLGVVHRCVRDMLPMTDILDACIPPEQQAQQQALQAQQQAQQGFPDDPADDFLDDPFQQPFQQLQPQQLQPFQPQQLQPQPFQPQPSQPQQLQPQQPFPPQPPFPQQQPFAQQQPFQPQQPFAQQPFQPQQPFAQQQQAFPQRAPQQPQHINIPGGVAPQQPQDLFSDAEDDGDF